MEASVRDLRVNEAQMRTRVAVAELARLAVQVREGLDPSLALLLRPDGEGGFKVISGHRRWLALMIAFMAQADLDREPDLEGMQAVIEDVCGSEDGFVLLDEELYTFLQEQMPETLMVPYRLWEGPPEEEVLLLIKANSGAEEPDLVGQARAFAVAHARGVPYDRLAQVTGLPLTKVRVMVEMLALPDIFLQLLNDGLLHLEAIPPVFGLSQVQVKALAEALKVRVVQDAERLTDDQSLRSYTQQVGLAILQMAIEPEVPKRTTRDPASVNYAATVKALWERAREEAPDQLYRAIATQSLGGERLTSKARQVDLLSEVPVVKDCFDVEKGRFDQTVVITDQAMKEASPDRECAGCAFIDLPAERVRHELPLPCRSNPAGSAFGPCWHWAPKGKKFSLRTPWKWDGGMAGKLVTSFDELLEIWQKQWDWEHRRTNEPGVLSGSAESVTQQRDNVRAYMTQHLDGRFDLVHPWATACARCAHHLDKSPIKSDPEAPHCQWAKGRRRLQFRAFVPVIEGKEASQGIIPYCLQYSPDQEWAHIVPEAITSPPFSRGPMLLLLKRLAQSVNRNVYSTDCRAALQFLTGRPAKASASHRQTFVERLAREEAHLSNLQIWTLLQWVLFEWERVETGSSHQMVPAVEGYFEAHVTYFGMVMPGGVMEEVWDD